MAKLGDNIRRLRESAGMSQDQLGARINKTRSAVSQYESGKIVPRMGVIEDMAHVFRVTKSEILGDVSYAVVSLDDGRADEQRIIELFRKMDEEGRARLLEQAEFLACRHSLGR